MCINEDGFLDNLDAKFLKLYGKMKVAGIIYGPKLY